MSILLLNLPPDSVTEEEMARIRALVPHMRILHTRDRAQIETHLDEIEIAAGGFPHDLLPKARNLRWLQQWGAGADWLLRYPEAVELPFILTNVSGIHAIPISEHIFAFLLAFARDFPHAWRGQMRHEWRSYDVQEVFELAGQTMLLVGVGAIGQRTAQLAQAFGMHVIGIRRDPTKAALGVDEMHGPETLPSLLPRADAVVLTAPLTAETYHMIGEAQLRAMKPTAILVNIGRGGLVDEAALIRALQEGWIRGAGLDVFETEPLPPDSPLWEMENVIITGHYSGKTPYYDRRAMAIFLDNLERYVQGRPLRNVVDKRRGY